MNKIKYFVVLLVMMVLSVPVLLTGCTGENVTTHRINVYTNDYNGGTLYGQGDYVSGEVITIAAVANTGYRFVEWSDGDCNAVRSMTVLEDKTFKAIFEKCATQLRFYSADFLVTEQDSPLGYYRLENVSIKYNNETIIEGCLGSDAYELKEYHDASWRTFYTLDNFVFDEGQNIELELDFGVRHLDSDKEFVNMASVSDQKISLTVDKKYGNELYYEYTVDSHDYDEDTSFTAAVRIRFVEA